MIISDSDYRATFKWPFSRILNSLSLSTINQKHQTFNPSPIFIYHYSSTHTSSSIAIIHSKGFNKIIAMIKRARRGIFTTVKIRKMCDFSRISLDELEQETSSLTSAILPQRNQLKSLLRSYLITFPAQRGIPHKRILITVGDVCSIGRYSRRTCRSRCGR